MKKYIVLITIYLAALASTPIANLLSLDIQNFYRVPFINVRLIDVGILTVIGFHLYSWFQNDRRLPNITTISSLCYIFIFFEIYQLSKSWGELEANFQISWFFTILSLFVIIDLNTFKIKAEKIIAFTKRFSLWGAVVLSMSNAYLLYSFITGKIIFIDSDIRVGLDVVGSKETVFDVVLIPIVFLFSLYSLQIRDKVLWHRVIYIAAIGGIFLSLVISFHRGNLVTILLLIIIYFLAFSNGVLNVFRKVIVVTFLIGVCYMMFGNILKEKGYDPVDKLIETAQFAMDVENPDWDKGRSIPREYALSIWNRNLYTGVGYTSLQNYGLPENISSAHNFVITSLFHRGIVGTAIYLLILVLAFKNAISLWSLANRKKCYENDVIKILIISSFFWFIPFWTQEIIWEKYSMTIQFLYLGLISNLYKQIEPNFYKVRQVIKTANYNL